MDANAVQIGEYCDELNWAVSTLSDPLSPVRPATGVCASELMGALCSQYCIADPSNVSERMPGANATSLAKNVNFSIYTNS